jgi:hypothetical protein
MSVRIKYDIVPDFVKPKLEDFDVPTITVQEYILKPSQKISATINPQITKREDISSGITGGTSGDSWNNWTISLSLDGIDTTVKGAENFFKTLDKITETITLLLKIIRLLSGNVISTSGLIKFAIKQLAKVLKEFINSLVSTGIYSSLITPDFDKTFPKYSIPTFGGYQEFITRVNATCLSSTDSDAPKFVEADKVGGVIIAMLGGVDDPDYLRNLLDNFKKLSSLFGFKIPYPSPAQKFKATPGFYNKNGIMTLGVKLVWESPETPVGSFYVYRKSNLGAIPVIFNLDGVDVPDYVFTNDDPILKQKYNPLRPSYSYIDFDIKQETNYLYKIYSVFGDDYLEEHPYLKSISSPIATPQVLANVPMECIPISELKKYMNLSISGELLSPFDLEGDWQSVTVRRMLGKQVDGMFNNLDALTDKLLGLVSTGSDAINDYLKFYGEKVEDLLAVTEKIKNLVARLASFSMRGTFMVLNLPLEKGGMRGFVDRFNKACNSGTSTKETPKDSKSLNDYLKNAGKVEKNSPIATFNEKGIMLGLILLYGIPNLDDPNRLKEIVPENSAEGLKKKYEDTGKAISTLLKMLGLG